MTKLDESLIDITVGAPEDEENKTHFIVSIVFLIIGIFLPPFLLLTLIFRNKRNRKVQIVRFIALFIFWFEFLICFIGGWVALVYFMEWWPVANWPNGVNIMYNDHFKIGEIFAVIFGVLFFTIVMYETCCGVTDFVAEKLHKDDAE